MVAHLPAQAQVVQDSPDAHRRFELAYPQIGRGVNALPGLPIPEMAAAFLDLADEHLGTLTEYPTDAVEQLRGRLTEQDTL